MYSANQNALHAIIDYDVVMISKPDLGLDAQEMMESINNILDLHHLKSQVVPAPDSLSELSYEEDPSDMVTDNALIDVIDYLASLNLYGTEETLGYLNDTLRMEGTSLRLIVYAFPEAPVRYEFEVVHILP